MKVSSLTENYEPIQRMAQKTEKLRQELRKMSKAGHKKPSLSVDVDDGQALSDGTSPTPSVRRASETNGNMADLGATLNGPGRRLVSTRASRQSINSDDDDEGGVQTMRAGVGNSVNGASKAMGGFSGVSKFSAGTIKSPSMFSRKSSMNTGSPTKWGSSMGSGSLAQMDQQQSYIQRISNLEEEVVKWKDRVKDLVADGEKRQASYMRREDELQHKVDQQREELDVMSGKRPKAISEEAERLRKTTIGPTTIQDLHGQVISGIEVLLRKQEVALKHGEATSIRHFKDKLAEVEAQVAAERAALSHINDDWLKKTVAMRNDLESTQAIATKLDQMYKLSEEECLRLKAQYKCQEDDRQYLIRQIVSLKNDNKRLTTELERMNAELQEVMQERDNAVSMTLLTSTLVPHSETYQNTSSTQNNLKNADIVQSLQKMLDQERKRTRQARAAHTALLQQRTELQSVLRQCLDDVRSKMPADGGVKRASISGAAVGVTGDSGPTVSHGTRVQAPGFGSYRPASARVVTGNSNRIDAGASYQHSAAAAAAAGLSSSTRRPTSAALRTGRRPFSAAAGMPASVVSAEHDGGAAELMMVPSGSRSEFVEELMKREQLLIQLYTSAFPPPQPLIPGDAAMDAVMAQEERHVQEVLQAARQAGQMTRPVSAATVSSTATASSKPVNLLEQRQQKQLQLGIGNINNVTSTAGSVNNSASAIQAGDRGGPPAGKEQFSSNGFGACAVVPAGLSSSTTNNQLRPASAVSKPPGWSLNTNVQLAEFLSGGGGSTRTPGASSVGPLVVSAGAIASNSSSVLGTEGDGDTGVSNVQNNKPVVAGALSSWGRPVSAAAPSNRR